MCIYCGTTKYRKIYENHYGPIPRDPEGRKYEVHHIDGDRANNDPTNLTCVSIQEHYNIHYSQRDWAACLKIGAKMKLSPEKLSEIAKAHNKTRVENGTHHFLGGEIQHRRVREGTHHLMGDGELQRKNAETRIKNGTHNFLDKEAARQRNIKRLKAGTHHLAGGEHQKKQIATGTHPFLGNNSTTKMSWQCPHCKKTGKGKGPFNRWHGDNCSQKDK